MADEGGPADKEWVPTADEVDADKKDEEMVPAAAAKRKPSNVDATKKNLLDRLKAYFEENDVLFEDGWRIEVKQRTGGSSAGTSDAYYYNPEGKRFRSRAEIAREYGISVEKAGGRGGAPRPPLVLLSREDALAAVQARSVAAVLPLKASGGVTVTSFGAVRPEYVTEAFLPLVGYAAAWTDKRGVRFTSTITDTGHGPYYSVRAGLASASAAPVEVGAGLTPDAAWAAVEERQHELLEARGEGEAGGEGGDEEEADAGDALLARAAPLTGCWGTERFGFIDVPVLQALEAQPGVAATAYRFVEERSSWDEENRRLMREAAAHTRAAGGAGPARPRADRRPRTQEERAKAAVGRVVEGMVRQLEAMEAKSAAAAQRAMAKREREVARQMEKEERRMAKEREREIARRLHEQQRELARQQAAEAARRAAEAARTFPDEELEGARAPPPAPRPLLSGAAPPAAEPALLEAWHLLHAFSDLLGVERGAIPPLARLEAALLGAPAPDDALVWVASALVNFLVGSLFNRCADAICTSQADVPDKDLRPHPKAPHPLPVGRDTWQEAARRYLAAVADAAACLARQEEGRGGLPYPSDHLEDWLLLQHLLAAPPAALARGWGALPKGSSDHAWLGDTARCDAAALAAAAPAPPGPATAAAIRLQRAILRQLATARGERGRSGKVLCFVGHAAAAATKHGRSLDLRYVGARVDARVYAAAPDPLAAFAADVRFVVELHAAAAAKRASGFAELTKDKGVDEVCALVASRLDAALEEVAAGGAEAYLAAHAPPVAQPALAWREARAAAHAAAAQPGADAAALLEGFAPDDEPLPVSDAVHDLGRPFAPWDGCAVCWDDVDDARILLCSRCSAPFHTYCLDPPLEEVPPEEEDWLCPGCAGGPPAAPPLRFPAGSGAAAVWEMVGRLAGSDYAGWGPGERAALLRMLCMLVADSPQLRDLLVGEEKAVADKRKELHARRAELKAKQAEEAAAPAPPAEGAPAAEGEPAPPRRSREAAAAEIQALVERISALEAEVSAATPHAPRLEPLGLDRHWNRYWALPAEALGGDALGPGAVVVERARHDGGGPPGWSPAQGPPGDWEVGMYAGADSLNALIGWLNPRGEREKALAEALKTERTRQGVRAAEAERHRKETLIAAQLAEAEGRAPPPAEAAEAGEGAAAELDAGAPSADRLRAKLLDTEANLLPAARHPLFGSDEAMEAWRRSVAAAAAAPDFSRALIALERAIRPDWLKTHWRPWSMLAPHPDASSALAAPWLRLEALRDAIRIRVPLKLTAAVAAAVAAGPRYPKREKRSAGPDSGADSGADSDAGGRGARDVRAAKRSRGNSAELDDEELARRLHAELNAPRGVSRLRHSSRGEAAAEARRAERRASHSLREHTRVSYRENDGDEDDELEEELADEEMEEAATGEEETAGGADGGDDYEPSAEED